MSEYIYPKGSEWRKWDLHVHTPASFHWRGQRFAAMTPEEKVQSLKLMLDTINNSDVSVFGIMDYWTFDGYLEFMRAVSTNGWDLKKTVLPGMELRIESPTNYRLNIHVILSNELSEQQLIDFKSSLRLRLVDRILSDEALAAQADILGNDKKRELGFDPENMDSEARLKFGSMVAEVTKDSFVAAIKSIRHNKGFVLLPYDTSDGLSHLDWKRFPITDTFYLRLADIFESRKQDTIDLFNGCKTEKNGTFIEEFTSALGGEHKPAVSGSDAHAYADYGVYPNNKITWIKADPNFSGLTQIIHEPETRVKVSQNKPNPKTSYMVIDKVRFLDDREKTEFGKEWIELNEGLNVIIGGKSSGKSLLLHNIAKTIDPKQVGIKNPIVYDFEAHPTFDFEVRWVDGSNNLLKEVVESKTKHQITYIPQLYIHHLADEKGQENLRGLILDILLQSSEFNEFYTKHMDQIGNMSTNIDKEIIELFNVKADLEKATDLLNKMGDKNAVVNEIKKIEDEINLLKISSGFTSAEEAIYTDLISKRDLNEIELNRLKSIKKALEDFEKEFKNLTNVFAVGVQNARTQINQKFQSDEKSLAIIRKYTDDLINIFAPSLSIALTSIKYEEIDLTISSHISTEAKIFEELTPFNAKFANQSRLGELQKNLEYQKKILSNILGQENQVLLENDKFNKVIKDIIDNYSLLLKEYQAVNDELNKDKYNSISEDMKLNTNILIDKARFFKQFIELFNRQKKLFKVLDSCFDENDDLILDTFENHILRIETIFRSLLSNNDLKLKTSYELKTAILALLDNYYVFDFNLYQKNDPFMHMSPGKRGLVLLQLFLHLSNSTHPILIDQPEDNLDNRTIYTELNSFIKSKKINRQIILVTHNANLVVLTDAEQVIVANQSGQQVERENAKYRFEYISGSLECSFINETAPGILLRKGIKEHVCEILEGGREAFEKRERKYGF